MASCGLRISRASAIGPWPPSSCRAEADVFARKVLAAVNLVHKDYVQEIAAGRLAGWAIRGLCQRLEETKVLDDFGGRLSQSES